MLESRGPVFLRPIRNEDDAGTLNEIDPIKDLKFVLDCGFVNKKGIERKGSTYGFSGSPWTLLTYMVEGKGSKEFFSY